MKTKPRHAFRTGALLALLFAAPAMAATLNKSIRIGDGEEVDSQSSVNGSITVGSDATVNGSLETVNGTIRVDENSRVGSVQTVNGGIRLADGVTADDVESVNGAIRIGARAIVNGGINVVNGKITLDEGASVARELENVNGEIQATAATIGGDLTTVNGDVELLQGSVLEGDLTVKEPRGWRSNRNGRKPRIVIGANSRVTGTIVLEREVDLYISDTAEVGGVSGKMSEADAVRFSGDRP